MKTLNNLLTSFKDLSSKDAKKYASIIIGIILLLCSFMIYRYFAQVDLLKKQLRKINIDRQEAQELLSKDIKIKKKKEEVDSILKKGKNFKLIQYFDSVTTKLGLAQTVKDREVSSNELENLRSQGYSEVKLTINLLDINMKQLVELLNEFEQNERIYTKSLDITKSEMNPTIDVNIVIATIQPKEEISEITE